MRLDYTIHYVIHYIILEDIIRTFCIIMCVTRNSAIACSCANMCCTSIDESSLFPFHLFYSFFFDCPDLSEKRFWSFGRIGQVKIRGQRIELGEIESKLLCHKDRVRLRDV